MIWGVLLFLVPLIFLWIIISHIAIVHDGFVVVTEIFGRFSRVLKAGITILRPFERMRTVSWNRTEELPHGGMERFEFRGPEIRYAESIYDPPPIKVTSADGVVVTFNVIVYYAIVDVHKAVYSINDLYDALAQRLATAIRDVIAGATTDAILREGVDLADKVQEKMQVCNELWGVVVSKVDVQDISVPKELQDADVEATCIRRKSLALMEQTRTDHEIAVRQVQSRSTIQDHEHEAEVRHAEHELKIAEFKAKAESAIRTREIADEERRLGAHHTAGVSTVDLRMADALAQLATCPGTVVVPPEAFVFHARASHRRVAAISAGEGEE